MSYYHVAKSDIYNGVGYEKGSGCHVGMGVGVLVCRGISGLVRYFRTMYIMKQ